MPTLYLTFDDGPHQVYTPKLLDLLAHYDMTATFFLVGKQVEQNYKIVEIMHQRGHQIGNHSWSHQLMFWKSKRFITRELERTQHAIQQVIGTQPQYFRPPYGVMGLALHTVLKQLNLRPVFWSKSLYDWRQQSSSYLSRQFTNAARDNAIYLMHDGHCNASYTNRQPTLDMLEKIIPQFLNSGYDFKTINNHPKYTRNH